MKLAFAVILFISYPANMNPESKAGTIRAAELAHNLRSVIGRLIRRLRDQAHVGDLTVSQISALSRLENEGPMTVTALAKAEAMRPQSMGANVAALTAAGLVESAQDPNDGRQMLLSLTRTCREMVAAGRAKREDWLARTIAEKLSAPEQEHLLRAVQLLERLADE